MVLKLQWKRFMIPGGRWSLQQKHRNTRQYTAHAHTHTLKSIHTQTKLTRQYAPHEHRNIRKYTPHKKFKKQKSDDF